MVNFWRGFFFSMYELEWNALIYRIMQPRDNWSMQSRGGGCMSSAAAAAAAAAHTRGGKSIWTLLKRLKGRRGVIVRCPFVHNSDCDVIRQIFASCIWWSAIKPRNWLIKQLIAAMSTACILIIRALFIADFTIISVFGSVWFSIN